MSKEIGMFIPKAPSSSPYTFSITSPRESLRAAYLTEPTPPTPILFYNYSWASFHDESYTTKAVVP